MHIGTTIYYTLAFALSFFFASKWEKSELKSNRILYLLFSFSIIAIFCGIRFFVGNDYVGYYNGFSLIHKNSEFVEKLRWEPGIIFIIWIFKSSPIGYIPFLFVCTVITYFFIFKTLVREDVLKWGIFFTFTLGLLIMANDQVRQGVALSIFLYSIQYIEKGNFRKYLLWLIVASMFHFSALGLILVYFITKIKFSALTWVILLVISYLLMQFHVVYELLYSIALKIPYYGEHFASKTEYFQVGAFRTGLGILFKNFIAIIIAVLYNKLERPLYAKIFLMGAILANLTTGFMLIERFSYYMVYTNILVLPFLFKQRNFKQIAIVIATVCLIYFELQSLFALEKHGAVPYRTIFFENLKNPPKEFLKR